MEMDCFHLWIAFFDRGVVFRVGYDSPDSFPWENGSPEEDIPPDAPYSLGSLKRRRKVTEFQNRRGEKNGKTKVQNNKD